MDRETVTRAVSAAGGPLEVAYRLRLRTDRTVLNWMRSGRVPPHNVVPLCELTGDRFKPEQIRPDIFCSRDGQQLMTK